MALNMGGGGKGGFGSGAGAGFDYLNPGYGEGGSTGGGALGNLGNWANFASGDRPGGNANMFQEAGDWATGESARRKAREGQEDIRGSMDKEWYETKDINALMAQKENEYLEGAQDRNQIYQNKMATVSNDYTTDLADLKRQAKGQAGDARMIYENDILPSFKNIMQRSEIDSRDAMTLKEAGDPNNEVQKAIREMYEQQAQGVSKQGLADAGILNAMGLQSLGSQMGGVPMTGGQMQALQAGAMAQGGAAYSRAQSQMDRLREQGIESGFRESDLQYQRGQGALDRYSRSVGDYEGAYGRGAGLQSALRAEQGGLAQGIYGTKSQDLSRAAAAREGLAQSRLGMGMGQQQRDLAQIQDYYGTEQGMYAGNVAAARASDPMGMLGSLGAAALGSRGGGGGGGGGDTQTIQPTGGGGAPAPAATQTTYGYGGGYNTQGYPTGYNPYGYSNYAPQQSYYG